MHNIIPYTRYVIHMLIIYKLCTYNIHLFYFFPEAVHLRVLDLNTWGLSWPFSKDREARFRALRQVLSQSTYDVILLQELWFRDDHKLLTSASLPYATYFGTFNSGCSGYFLPLGCSGLTILSRHPFVDLEFTPFKLRGSFWSFDGEIFVQKGLARARIYLEGINIDFFTTHLVSYTTNPNRENRRVRYTQTSEMVKYMAKTNADVKIFAGDCNFLPLKGRDQPYTLLTSYLTDALVDKYPTDSDNPWFATFGNHHNTYTKESTIPERIDYLMYWAAPDTAMKCVNFTMPMYTTRNNKGKIVSLSDHEALQADFLIEKLPRPVGAPPPPPPRIRSRKDNFYRHIIPPHGLQHALGKKVGLADTPIANHKHVQPVQEERTSDL